MNLPSELNSLFPKAKPHICRWCDYWDKPWVNKGEWKGDCIIDPDKTPRGPRDTCDEWVSAVFPHKIPVMKED